MAEVTAALPEAAAGIDADAADFLRLVAGQPHTPAQQANYLRTIADQIAALSSDVGGA